VSATGSYFSRIFGNPRCFAARYSLTRNLRANLSPSRPRWLARPPPFVVSPRSSDCPRTETVPRVDRRYPRFVARFQRRSRFSRVRRIRSAPRRVHGEHGNAWPRAKSDGARARFARRLPIAPVGKPDVACQVGTPASAMLIVTPEVRIQADPRPKPLVPRPLPLAPCPYLLPHYPYPTSDADVRHSHGDPLSRFRRPRLLSSPSWPYRALLHAPAFSLRNTGYPTFPFLGLVEPSLAST
jgi:hypothetical protein